MNGEQLNGLTSNSLSNLVFVAALLLPSTAWWGGYDHWLSWELYAPRNSRVQILVNQLSIEELPTQLRQYVVGGETDSREGLWKEVDLAQWSLDQLNTPIYPQERFQLGVAKAIIDQVEDDRALRVVCQSRSNRWTGRRAEKLLVGRQAIDRELDRFWFNPIPRDNVDWNP